MGNSTNGSSSSLPEAEYSGFQPKESNTTGTDGGYCNKAKIPIKFSQRVLIKIYGKANPVIQDNNNKPGLRLTTRIPRTDTQKYSLDCIVEGDISKKIQNSIHDHNQWFIDEVSLDYQENHLSFPLSMQIKGLLLEYNVDKFINDYVAKQHCLDSASVQENIIKKVYASHFPLTVELKKMDHSQSTNADKEKIIFKPIHNATLKNELIKLIMNQNGGLGYLFSNIKVPDQKSFIISTQNPLALTLWRWGILPIPNSISIPTKMEDENVHNHNSNPYSHSTSGLSDYSIPRSKISVVKYEIPTQKTPSIFRSTVKENSSQDSEKSSQIADHPTDHKPDEKEVGFKILKSVYFETVTNICNQTGFKYLYPLKPPHKIAFSLNLNAEEETLILNEILDRSKISNDVDCISMEICSFILQIKGFY